MAAVEGVELDAEAVALQHLTRSLAAGRGASRAVGICRYARQAAYEKTEMQEIVLPMGAGSAAGAVLGAFLLPYPPAAVLKVGLRAILIVSAVRLFRHRS